MKLTQFKVFFWCLNLAVLLALAISIEQPAQAYADPGSSLLLFQGMTACFTGAIFYFRRRLRNTFSKFGPHGKN